MNLHVPELNKTFESKNDMFAAIKQNKEQILKIKRKQIVESKIISTPFLSDVNCKALDANYVYPVISVTNLYDSHRDVHFKGSMTKTVKEQQGKVVYAIDHDLSISKIIAWEDELEMLLLNLTMDDLGYKGDNRELEGLAFKINRDTLINCGIPAVKRIIEKKRSIQNSIRMVYYKIGLGINSQEQEYKEEYEYYQKRISEIYNSDEVEEIGYFYGVEELGIKDEGSMVVKPSQNAAITIYPQNIEPSKDTQAEPLNALKSEQLNELLKFKL